MWIFVSLLVLLFAIFYYVDYKTNAVIAKAKKRLNLDISSEIDLVDVLMHQTPRTYFTQCDITPTVHK